MDAQTDSDGDATYSVRGLSEPAEILVDEWGIPHMYASSTEDVFFLQGFNAARDRLWQIDLWRRRGLGRMSATFGPSYVRQDRAARLFLYRGEMYEEWLAYGSDAKLISEAFVRGVNEYIGLTEEDGGLLPVEFERLGYRPEKWSPEDVVRIRSHGLTRNAESEVARALTLRGAGEVAEAMRQRLEPRWEIKVPEGLDLETIPEEALEVYDLGTLELSEVEFTEEAARASQEGAARSSRDAGRLGSNNWAISPERTTTGRPILANDPHRSHAVPSLRYAAHLSAPDLDVIGAGEPFLPGISIGHNDRVAFGLTIFAIDQEDLYVYETNPDDPDQYRYDGGWETMQVETQEIDVAGGEPEEVELRFTRHGPVIYTDEEKNLAIALRAAWLEPGMAPYFGSVEYMRAQGWDDFLAAMNRWGAPSENQVYADVDGNIGWKPGGLTPIRPNWDGLLPVPGDGRYEWEDFLTQDLLPVEFNPSRGWVATANEMNLPDDYPHEERKLGFEWSEPFRIERISEVLSQNSRMSVRDNLELQTDHLSVPARDVVALLDGLQTDDPEVRGALEMLGGWDAVVRANSSAAAIFEVWFSSYLGGALVAEVLSPEAAELVGQGDARVVLDLLQNPDERLGDDPTSARDRVLLSSLSDALARLRELLGEDMQGWKWGDLHEASFEHIVSGVVDEELADQLDVGPRPRGGSTYTVGNVAYGSDETTGAEDDEYFQVVSGSSWRMVLDVGEWDNSVAMNSPGQSGDPESPHYDDLFASWAGDEAFPLLYSREKVEAATKRRIRLKPA